MFHSLRVQSSTHRSLMTHSLFKSFGTASTMLTNCYGSSSSSSSSSLKNTTTTTTTTPTTTTIRKQSLQYRNFRSTSRGMLEERHGTTIVCIRKNGQVCMMGDGMVSMGSVIVKPNARKIRRIVTKEEAPAVDGGDDDDKDNDNDDNHDDDDEEKKGNKERGGTVVGFAGSTADAFTLVERLEGFLDQYPGQLSRSCVELAKGWRTDKYLRRLDAAILVADKNISLELTGNGDVLESHDGVLGVGSGSAYAVAAARALMDIPELSAEDVARKAMTIAGDMCVYTNHNFIVETLDAVDDDNNNNTKKESDDDDDDGISKVDDKKNEQGKEETGKTKVSKKKKAKEGSEVTETK